MYQIGDFVVYGSSGVCKVSAIGTPEMRHADKAKSYYTLVPLYSTEIIYTPVDTKVFMRPVLSQKEAENLIQQIPKLGEKAVEAKTQPLLTEQYQMSFQSHNCNDLICLVKAIYKKTSKAKSQGKKPAQIDEKYRKRAEDLLYGELAVALKLEKDEVKDYLKAVLEGTEKAAKTA